MDSSYFYTSIYQAACGIGLFCLFLYTVKSAWFHRTIGEKQIIRFKKFQLFLYPLLFLSITYVVIKDDELNPEIIKILEQYKKPIAKNDNGSIYHLGMWSNLESAPYKVGLWRIEQYENAYLNTKSPTTVIDYEDYPEDRWIEDLFDENQRPKWLCSYDEIDCLDLIYDNSEQAIYLEEKFKKHIARYNGSMNYSNFGLFMKPTIASPTMRLGPTIDILKIKVIVYFNHFKLGKKKRVITNLTTLLNHHKKVLDQTPYTIAKVVSIVNLQRIYKAAAFLISKTNDKHLTLWSPYIQALKQLNNHQITFDKPLLHEFVITYYMLKAAGLVDVKTSLSDIINYLPKSFIYKPNRTINMIFEATTLNHGRYKFKGDYIVVREVQEVNKVIQFELFNPLGSLLAIATTPKFIHLDGQLHNLEILQRLTKYLYFKRLNNNNMDFFSPYTAEKGKVIGKFYCIEAELTEDEPLCLSNR